MADTTSFSRHPELVSGSPSCFCPQEILNQVQDDETDTPYRSFTSSCESKFLTQRHKNTKIAGARLLFVLGLLCLALISPAYASEPVNADPYEGWNPLKPDPFIANSPADAMKWQLRGFPESLEGNQKLEMRIEKIPGGMLGVSVIQEGLLDDSTAATWTYAELAPRDDGKWDVTMKGEKWRCARSGSNEWVITPCP